MGVGRRWNAPLRSPVIKILIRYSPVTYAYLSLLTFSLRCAARCFLERDFNPTTSFHNNTIGLTTTFERVSINPLQSDPERQRKLRLSTERERERERAYRSIPKINLPAINPILEQGPRIGLEQSARFQTDTEEEMQRIGFLDSIIEGASLPDTFLEIHRSIRSEESLSLSPSRLYPLDSSVI